MRDLARTELDRIDKLKPGQGMLEAFLFGRGDLVNGMGGGALEYGHRLNLNTSLFARAEAGYRYGADSGFGYNATVGGRWRFD